MIANKLTKSVVITGGSGTGKTTLCRRLLTHFLLEPIPVHMTRKIRLGEIENIDAVFLTEEEFKSNFTSGKYLQETLESTYFSSSYYGCPKEWLDLTLKGQFTCFVSPTVNVAKKLKGEFGDKIFWIHLIANKETLLQRMNWRETNVSRNDFEQRVERAITSVNVDDSDLIIDTSKLNAWEIFFKALVKI